MNLFKNFKHINRNCPECDSKVLLEVESIKPYEIFCPECGLVVWNSAPMHNIHSNDAS